MAGIYNVSRRVGPQYFSYPPSLSIPGVSSPLLGLGAYSTFSHHTREEPEKGSNRMEPV